MVLQRGWLTALALFLCVGVPYCPGAARAEVIHLRDGFVLDGKIKRENVQFVDPITGQPFSAAMLRGFFMVDDDVRRIYFSHLQVRKADDIEERDAQAETDWVTIRRKIPGGRMSRSPNLILQPDFSPWDDNGERLAQLHNRPNPYKQRLTILTPLFARIDALNTNWTSFYFTRELEPAAVRDLLLKHPDFQEKEDANKALRRFRLYRFFLQAGWYEIAEKELADIRKDLPDQKDKVEQAVQSLKKFYDQELWEDSQRAASAGQYERTRKQLNRLLAKPELDDKLSSRAREQQARLTADADKVKLAQQLLKDTMQRVDGGSQRQLYTAALAVIQTELNPDTVGRLEAFLSLAQQADGERKLGKKPQQSPAELLALAVTGWLVGGSSAEAKFEAADRLWRGRQFLFSYLKTGDEIKRQNLLATYRKSGGLDYDEMAHLIGLSSPETPPNPSTGVVTLKIKLSGMRRDEVDYHVQLPPEYHHGRNYPVLFILKEGGNKARDLLQTFGYLAALHGYILVAPDWEDGLGRTYNFTPEEHAAVVDVVKDLRRRFQVDSDRVFLFGFAEGGNMAYDVGLSHPDLFAGVSTMIAKPKDFSASYCRNAQYLPFYAINGTYEGEPSDPEQHRVRRQFNHWVPHGYPALMVEYKGRGMEWYAAELPVVFDWMNRKKRALGYPELGKFGLGSSLGEEFCSMRPTDNRFYWLSSDSIKDGNLNNPPPRWSFRVKPATFQGLIGQGNQINLNVHGMKQVTVWLGSGMIDFQKGATVRMNGMATGWFNRPVKPSLEILLEDFYQRVDRQRQFWAKIELKL